MAYDLPMFAMQFNLLDAGWAMATVSSASASVEIRASYMSDALGDLARAILNLGPDQPQKLLWAHEPGYWRWTLSMDRAQVVMIAIAKLAEQGVLSPRNGDEVFRAQAPYIEIVAAISNVLASTYHTSAQRYAESWTTHEFPVAEMQQLEELLRDES